MWRASMTAKTGKFAYVVTYEGSFCPV
jgi:hypothetical protein